MLGEEIVYLLKELLNLIKCVGRNCGNVVGVDLEVIILEEVDRGWIGENELMWVFICDLGFSVLVRLFGVGFYLVFDFVS